MAFPGQLLSSSRFETNDPVPMKYKWTPVFTILLLASSMFVVTACDSFLDVNENPNEPQTAPIEQQLPGLIGEFSHTVISGWPTTISARFSQQTSANGTNYYYNLDRYQLGQPWFTWNDLWDPSYVDIMKNARMLTNQAEERGAPAYAGISRLIYAWNMAYVTDGWGTVPFSEAFEPSNTTPKYEAQENIYPEIMNLVDQAITDLEENASVTPGSEDLLYGGDMNKWRKMAYTFKARLLLRLSEAPDNQKQQRAQQALQALQNGFESNADDAEFQYVDEEGGRNPWYRVNDGLEYHRMAAHHIDLLKSLDDPRLSIQAEPAPAYSEETYVGHPSGGTSMGQDSVSAIGMAYSGPDVPGRWITYSEAKFLEAEAHFILNNLQEADAAYREGIRANMRKYGVASDEIDSYLQSRPSLSSSENVLRDIITQKYISNFLTAEPWNDWRRTGYPELEPPEQSAIEGMAVRYAWPGSELSNNRENLEATGLPTDRNVMLHRVWWDTTPTPGSQ